MTATTYTNLKQNLKTYLDNVVINNEPLIITRKNNDDVVLISVNEYNSLVETNYLLSNEANAGHLIKSIEQHKTGQIKTKEIYEND